MMANGVAVKELPAPAPGSLAIPDLNISTVLIRLVGDSPLICHAWSEKAKRQMRDKQMGKATAGKEHKDPNADYEAAFYRLDDGRPGFPCIAFKAAAVSGARQLKDMKMTFLRGAFHIDGELVPIEGEPQMREDMVRVGMGTADIRYRPEFPEWSVVLPVKFNRNAITLEQVVGLFNVAGFAVGVGEWRPEKDGPYGRFSVASVAEV